MSDQVLREAELTARYVGRLLSCKAPQVQAAVLADLTAVWLAGHRTDNPDATRSLRAEILSLHCAAVRRLVTLADEEAAQ
jgi:hypothetical protein